MPRKDGSNEMVTVHMQGECTVSDLALGVPDCGLKTFELKITGERMIGESGDRGCSYVRREPYQPEFIG
jgi:hypothetical protein